MSKSSWAAFCGVLSIGALRSAHLRILFPSQLPRSTFDMAVKSRKNAVVVAKSKAEVDEELTDEVRAPTG
jgi:hypothetical protein